MSRLWLALVIAVAGCAAAAEPSTTVSTSSTSSVPLPSATTDTTPPATSTTTTAPGPLTSTYLVWTSGGMTDALVAGLEATFETMSIVTGDSAPLDIAPGQVVPLDAIGLDVEAHSSFDPDGETSVLREGTVLLGATSAAYRGLDVGDSLVFGGRAFEIVGVVSDFVVGAAEVVFSKRDAGSPVKTSRYALIETEMRRPELEAAVTALNDASVPPRIIAEGESPFLRHADGVLPQIFIKEALGEFSYPVDAGSTLVQDDIWLSENIVTAEVPILGSITCHRVVVDMVTGALTQLIDEGLGDLVDPIGFAGCWNPRFVRTVTGTPTGVSRHSWGAALDINAPTNQLGTDGDQDPRLVEIMGAWGFGWGGDWTVPDPMHFEYEIWPAG